MVSGKLLNVIAEDYTLIRKGKFFTTEEHDSLIIDPRKGLFFWNSKGIFGDEIDYLTKVRNVSFTEAIQLSAEAKEEFESRVYEILPEIPNPALVNIFYEYGKDYREYWYEKRGYTDRTIDNWKLGYTGKFHVIPIYFGTRFVNFQCRGKDSYGNKITKPFYQGGANHPFNIDNLPEDKSIPIFIGESPAESIILEQNGYQSIGNLYGAMSWDSEWSRFLFDREKIFFCYDNDDAGRKGAKRGCELLKHNSYILNWPKKFPHKYDLTDLFLSGETLNMDWFVPSYIF